MFLQPQWGPSHSEVLSQCCIDSRFSWTLGLLYSVNHVTPKAWLLGCQHNEKYSQKVYHKRPRWWGKKKSNCQWFHWEVVPEVDVNEHLHHCLFGKVKVSQSKCGNKQKNVYPETISCRDKTRPERQSRLSCVSWQPYPAHSHLRPSAEFLKNNYPKWCHDGWSLSNGFMAYLLSQTGREAACCELAVQGRGGVRQVNFQCSNSHRSVGPEFHPPSPLKLTLHWCCSFNKTNLKTLSTSLMHINCFPIVL